MAKPKAILLGGIPSENPALFHRVQFPVGDPAAWIAIEADGRTRTQFIVRDIEMQRAKQQVRVDAVACPADFTPEGGLSGDRATATAQAVAECMRRGDVESVTVDRSLPYIFAWHIEQAGVAIEYSADLGVLDRRVKSEEEIVHLAAAQEVTEKAMLMACQTVARAVANSDGILQHEGAALTSERLQQMISVFLLNEGYSNHHGCIVASRPDSADCHQRGSGDLKTDEAVIIDIFPQSMETHYWGDCTRTVVRGQVSDEVRRMHAAVIAAKSAATSAAIAGNSADDVHTATKETLQEHGYRFSRGEVSDIPVMPHGTGHGIGLEVHEPILLDDNGGQLLAGEVFTIEPGLYSRNFGGVRVEDMVVVTDAAPRNLNQLPHGLSWE